MLLDCKEEWQIRGKFQNWRNKNRVFNVTAGDAPQAVYEARKQQYEIAINQDYDFLSRKLRNPTKSHHPPCAEMEGAVFTSRA